MTLRLGFVGCGKWARKLAESFRACGAEVVAHDRGTNAELIDARHPAALSQANGEFIQGFGYRQRWRAMLNNKNIDAIVAVAPPEITTEVAMACAAAGKPVMATKPLFDHPERIAAPFYVDFWRLWSEAHQRVKNDISDTRNWRLSLAGCGPLRNFPGLYDYGPHVVAAILDAIPLARLRTADRLPCPDGTDYLSYSFGAEGEHVSGVIGNGAPEGWRCIWGEDETPTHIGNEPKEAIMQKFCRSFLSDVSEGYVSTTLLDYSREGMRMLREIRERAK